MSENKQFIQRVNFRALTNVKYKNESEAKQQVIRMGLLLSKTTKVVKNDDGTYSVGIMIGKPEHIPINHTLEL